METFKNWTYLSAQRVLLSRNGAGTTSGAVEDDAGQFLDFIDAFSINTTLGLKHAEINEYM